MPFHSGSNEATQILYTVVCNLSFTWSFLSLHWIVVYMEMRLSLHVTKTLSVRNLMISAEIIPFYHDSENKDRLQVKYGKVQSSNSKVSEDRTDNADNTANLKNADMLHIDSLTSNVHFPIDITSREISSMNQSNCISAESLQ